MGCFMELIRKERGCQTVPPKARKPRRARDLSPGRVAASPARARAAAPRPWRAGGTEGSSAWSASGDRDLGAHWAYCRASFRRQRRRRPALPPGRRPRAPSPTPKAAPCHLHCWGPGDPQESLRPPQCSDLGAAWPRDKGGHRLPAFPGASGSRTEVFLGPLNDRNPDPAVRSETWALGGDRRGAETPACQ